VLNSQILLMVVHGTVIPFDEDRGDVKPTEDSVLVFMNNKLMQSRM
jgi:hypothetical protein